MSVSREQHRPSPSKCRRNSKMSLMLKTVAQRNTCTWSKIEWDLNKYARNPEDLARSESCSVWTIYIDNNHRNLCIDLMAPGHLRRLWLYAASGDYKLQFFIHSHLLLSTFAPRSQPTSVVWPHSNAGPNSCHAQRWMCRGEREVINWF